MDRTTRDESEDDSEDTNDSEEPRLSSDDTLEAEMDFVSSEEDLAAPSTESSNEEHEEQVSRGEEDTKGTIDILPHADEAQQATVWSLLLTTLPRQRAG
jgi:hypothetical protein